MHRDLKPENIMLGELKHIKVIDFGDAKYLDEDKNAKFRVDVGDEEDDEELMEGDECKVHDTGLLDDDELGDQSRTATGSKAEVVGD